MKKNNDKIYGRPYQNKSEITPKKTFKQKIKDNLNKILFWVIISAFCLFTVGSTLGIIAYTRTAKADGQIVYDDNLYYSRGVYIPCASYSIDWPLEEDGGWITVMPASGALGNPQNYKFSFIVGSNTGDISTGEYSSPRVYISSTFWTGTNVYGTNQLLDLFPTLQYNDLTYYELTSLLTVARDDNGAFDRYLNVEIMGGLDNAYYRAWFYGGYPKSTGHGNITNFGFLTTTQYFNGVVSRVAFGYHHIDDSDSIFGVSPDGIRISNGFNHITFYDTDGGAVRFSFNIAIPRNFTTFDYKSLFLDTRSYFLDTALNDNEFYINGLEVGRQEGLKEGREEGYRNGYNEGKTAGINIGYDRGRIDGLNTASEATLYNLVSTIFNVPITSFIHLINFEFFGVNLANFFTGILTLAVILFIVSKVWGK